ncbi:phospholipase A [Sphingomonas sp. S1-29]|uniref:phospholipase A n=1 Tax=Sphingomonas sp. S1-29 TaxID=2991074 RepID=UPI00223F80B7|nr:phospholipase A [Sphingomonas sp. S1-29]UZK69083.1 phospholipase A [Sphingomonas sp. S1-29]
MRLAFATAALSCLAAPAAAQLRPVADQPTSADAAQAGVDVLFVNDGNAAADPQPPETIEVTAADGTRLRLQRDQAAVPFVAAGGFTRLRYRPAPRELAEAAPVTTERQDAVEASRETVALGSTGTGSAILDRFAPYRPVYGAFGAGDSGAKLQLSFAFQPFETNGALNGLRLAWTQTMFWRIDLPSGPFRSTNYSPEIFYEVPLAQDTVAAVGYAHDSNGRGAVGSIDVNRIYARVAHRFDLGDRWYAEVAPQAWFYVGARGMSRDLDRYWGYTALGASIGQVDGVKLALTARGNPGTGKGAAELSASYPLARVGGGLGIYLFGQGFTGFGEALDDYRLRDTHARLGIALTR